uniref:AARP2CN domain-containing protein n=1 Tax=Eptatretus burgeri TaxID=7764 RepID=A0A8C4QHN9_EPTBU
MPRVMTVLTHLDLIRAGGHLKKARRIISRRLWGEGSSSVGKVFQLSGFLNGEYLYKDVHNLARFISVMNFHSPTLQLSSPHLLADRMEDLTDPEKVRQNPWCDRRLCLYGYLRGAPMRSNSQVHIPGVGDLSVASVGPLPDPCPAPGSASGGRRRLGESQRLLYAPFGGQGGLLYDRDAVYLDIGGSHSHAKPVPGSDLVSSLRDSQTTLDSKIAAGHMTLFSESQPFAPGRYENHF